MVKESNTPETGIYESLPRSSYDSWDAISHSDMIRIERGDSKPSKNRALLIGNALHSRFECREFDLYRHEYPALEVDLDLRNKESKEKFKALVEKKGPNLLRASEDLLVENMFKSILSHDIGKALYQIQSDEVSILSVITGDKDDRVFGEHSTLCKGRLDKVTKNRIWDLKTTQCRDEDEFKDSIVKFNYDSQAAMYTKLYMQEFGSYKPFSWLCVSKVPPHNVFVPMHTSKRPLPGPYMIKCGIRRINTWLNFIEKGNGYNGSD